MKNKTLDKADGKADGIVKASGNEEIALAIMMLLRKVDVLQSGIEQEY